LVSLGGVRVKKYEEKKSTIHSSTRLTAETNLTRPGPWFVGREGPSLVDKVTLGEKKNPERKPKII